MVPQVPADEPALVQIVRDFWIRWPSKKPYNLESPEKLDFSMGQSAVVDHILQGKVGAAHGIFKKLFIIALGAVSGSR